MVISILHFNISTGITNHIIAQDVFEANPITFGTKAVIIAMPNIMLQQVTVHDTKTY